MNGVILQRFPGAAWAISRYIDKQWLKLIEGKSLEDKRDAELVLMELGLRPTAANLDHYFPVQGAKGPCPTHELMEKFFLLDNSPKEVKQSI